MQAILEDPENNLVVFRISVGFTGCGKTPPLVSLGLAWGFSPTK